MKITIYELLRLVKDDKAPKRIKSEGHYYNYNELEKDYYEGMGYDYEYLLANTSIEGLDDEIEIIEDKEEKKIPAKVKIGEKSITVKGTTFFREKDIEIFQKLSMEINEIIDYLDYLKSKGE